MKNVTAEGLTSGNRLARNAIYSLLGQALPMLVGIVSIPILIKHLGTDRFGILTLSWIVISYFSLFDLGLGRALTQLVAERLGKGDDEKSISELTWTASLLMLTLGLVGAVVFALLAPWLVHQVLNVPMVIQSETLTTFYILAFSIPVVTSTAGLVGFLSALQRFDLINLVRVPMGLFMFLGPLLALPFSNQLTYVVGILLIGRVVCWAIYGKLCVKAMPALIEYRAFKRELWAPLMKFGGWMTLTNIVGPLMVYMDRFLISGLISVTAVAYYATPYEVVTKLWIIPGALVTVLFPAFSSSFGEDPRRTESLFYRGVKYIFLALFPIVMGIILFAYEGLDLWLSKEFAQNSAPVLQWLAIGVLMNSLAQVPFSLIQGIGRPDVTSKLHLLELPFYVSLLWWLTISYGIAGAAYAWVVRVAIDSIALFYISDIMGCSRGKFFQELQFLIVLVLSLSALCFLNLNIVQKTLVFFLLLVAFCFAAWRIILDVEERQLVRLKLSEIGLGKSV
jgi:O-antigen/teichoic acid export membrane protein